MNDETMDISDANGRLPELVKRASENDDAFTVLVDGKQAAVIVGHDWYEAAQYAMRDEYRTG